MRIPTEWERAEKAEAELTELKLLANDKEKELAWHRKLSEGMEARVDMLEQQLLESKLALEAAQKTIKGHSIFTETIRRNQEKTLMRVTSFLNGQLINDIEQDKVRKRVGNPKLTIDQRLEALMGEMGRVREERDRETEEKRRYLTDLIAVRNQYEQLRTELHTIKSVCLSLFSCFFSRVENPRDDGLIPTLSKLHDYVKKYEPSIIEDDEFADKCEHEWSARRDGMRCAKCGRVTFGVFAKEKA